MAYLNPTPGVANLQTVVELDFQANATITAGSIVLSAGKIIVPAIQKLTVNASNGTYEWSQLDSRSKKVVATVSTNSLATDIVIDRTTFFGNAAATAGSLSNAGILSAQSNKSYLAFKVRFDSPTGDGTGDTMSGVGYITQLAPTINPDQPVWQTPITIVVDGDFVVKTGDTL